MVSSEAAITRVQAIFRGNRCREMHVERVRQGLPWSPFVPSQAEAITKMLDLAKLQPDEVLVDIGSGDGRVLLAAIQRQPALRAALGVEIDATLVAQSRHKIEALGLTLQARVLHDDWLHVDLHQADVVILFFLPHPELAQLLQAKLRPGTRVITYVFRIPEWQPEQVTTTTPFMTKRGSSPIYVYLVPRG